MGITVLLAVIMIGGFLALLGFRAVLAQIDRKLLLKRIDNVEWNRFIQSLRSGTEHRPARGS